MMELPDNLYPRCICCGETPILGIAGGVVVWHRFVCDGCQSNLVSAEIDSPFYSQMLEAIKGLWGKRHTAGAGDAFLSPPGGG
ncbi:MAG: sigma factor G inhibitor Gin [Syntrophomonadaceae bacterium]|nr:sigma factor G inhibitor Gin [Syntrophomonadaceae bacterium]